MEARAKDVRIPKSIKLPGPFIIKVEVINDGIMQDRFAGSGDKCLAVWDWDTRTIFLNSKRTPKQRVKDLAHEMIHAINDWAEWISE